MFSRENSSGFTLIELLVVIAIIAILAAILFPVLVKARDNARIATCQSNQKQIALAFQMYTSDNNGVFPDYAFAHPEGATCPDGTTGWPFLLWPHTLSRYVKNFRVFNCPSVKYKSSDQGPYVGNYLPAWYLSYGYNYYYLERQTQDGVRYGSKTVLLCDSKNRSAGAYGDPSNYAGDYVVFPLNLYPTYTYMISVRHNNGTNVVFVDGHVKWLPASKSRDTTVTPNIWDRQ